MRVLLAIAILFVSTNAFAVFFINPGECVSVLQMTVCANEEPPVEEVTVTYYCSLDQHDESAAKTWGLIQLVSGRKTTRKTLLKVFAHFEEAKCNTEAVTMRELK